MSEREDTRAFWLKLAEVLTPPAGIPEFRTGFDNLMAQFAVPEGTEVTEVKTPDFSGLSVRAAGASGDPLTIWAHSGGYVFGSPQAYRTFGAGLSQASGGEVLLVDYGLAPENPYPAAVDDMVAAYRWALENGRDASQICIGGDSAGGGVAATTVLRLRDEGLPLPSSVVLNSPLTDQTWSGESMTSRADRDPVATRDALEMLSSLYRGDVAPDDPRVSALYGDWAGMPPVLVHVGSEEVLYDDSSRLVAKVQEAGGDAELVVGEGMFHIYPALAPISPTGQEALERIGAFVAAHAG